VGVPAGQTVPGPQKGLGALDWCRQHTFGGDFFCSSSDQGCIYTGPHLLSETIKVLCEQTREVNKLLKRFFGLCLILSGLGNIVVDFHF